MRLPKEEYNKAKSCLKRYNYNCVNILSTRTDLIGISEIKLDGLPHAQGGISDIVGSTVIKLEENRSYQRSIYEYNVVRKALTLVHRDSIFIFEHLYYKKDMTMWEIMDSIAISERTFHRRHHDLVYQVYKILKETKK